MAKKLTITISDEVYEGLHRHAGAHRIGQFLEALARPYVVSPDLEAAYREQALDEVREREAREWAEAGLGEGLPDDDFSSFPR
ncbi:hypothetical protein BH10PSE7_BH10PSE7_42880 [soil metagenome]